VTLDVLNQGNAVAILLARHREIGDQYIRVQLRKAVDQCCRVFKLTYYVNPFNLFQRLTDTKQNNGMVVGNNYVQVIHLIGYLAAAVD